MDDPFFIEFVRNSKESGATAELVLLIDGVCITGLMASDEHFVSETNKTIDGLNARPSEEVGRQQMEGLKLTGPLNQSDHHMTLREAKMISGLGERTLPVTRIGLRRVSGWGVVEAAEEESDQAS